MSLLATTLLYVGSIGVGMAAWSSVTIAEVQVPVDTLEMPTSRRSPIAVSNGALFQAARPASKAMVVPETETVSAVAPIQEVNVASAEEPSLESGLAGASWGKRLEIKTTDQPLIDEITLPQLLARLTTGLGAVAAFGLAFVVAMKLKQSQDVEVDQAPLQLISTLKIGPRVCLSLVNANGQQLLIARDAAGVKDIVPLPRSFESYVAEANASDASGTFPDSQLR